MAEGEPAPCVDTPEVYAIRPSGAVLPPGADWYNETEKRRNVLDSVVLSNPGSQTEDHNPCEAATRFVLSLEGVTMVLGGFSDKEQVDEIAGCSGRGPLSEQNMARLEMVWRANFSPPT